MKHPSKHPMKHEPYTEAEFGRSPLMCYFEVTQACDLVCKHCRASAQEEADPHQLNSEQARALIDQVAKFPRKPTLVMTGGDPLKRADIYELITYATEQDLLVALTPAATPLATPTALGRARDVGVRAFGISLDGADAATHDSFRGWEGSFQRTLEMLADARELQLPVQVNTTITRTNFHQIDDLAELLAGQGIAMWSVFFLVPVGRGATQQRISAQQTEKAFEKLWGHSQKQPYAVKTTEAPHYRRYVLQQGGHPLSPPKEAPAGGAPRMGHRAPLGVWDGRGVMFVSHVGEIHPAGFLPVCCGRFPEDSLVDAYQNHPTFLALRDPDGFHGKCGVCDYRAICGGSRARAYAVTGDWLASEPDCAYTPEGFTPSE